MAWRKTGMRDSGQTLRPQNSGEFAPRATWTPAMACEAFQASAKRFGGTCRCSWTEVHVDSGAMSAKSCP